MERGGARRKRPHHEGGGQALLTGAMANPSARQVIAAVRAVQPGILPAKATRALRGSPGRPVLTPGGRGGGTPLTRPAGPRHAETVARWPAHYRAGWRAG